MTNAANNLNEKLLSNPLSDNAFSAISGVVLGSLSTMFSPSSNMTSRLVTASIAAVEINAMAKKSNIEKDENKNNLLAFSGGVVTGAVTGALSNWLLGN